MWRRVVLVAAGVALVVDGLAGWHTDVAAVVVGLALMGGVSLDGLLNRLGEARSDAPQRPPGPPP